MKGIKKGINIKTTCYELCGEGKSPTLGLWGPSVDVIASISVLSSSRNVCFHFLLF